MAGFLPLSSGSITLNGRAVEGPGKERGVVFSKRTRYSWKTVAENVALGLKFARVGRKERRERALDLLRLVGLQDFAAAAPYELSGGMRQRVGIARALAPEPDILLMDEPFGALDSMTREAMQELLVDVWARTRKQIFFITHSIEEEAQFLRNPPQSSSPPRPGRIVARFDLSFVNSFCPRSRRPRESRPRRSLQHLREQISRHRSRERSLEDHGAMTDLAAADAEVAQILEVPPRVVKMRGFGIGDRSTLPISIATGVIIVAAWWAASEARLVPHLFLPTPREVVNRRDLVLSGRLRQRIDVGAHSARGLVRILTSAGIAIALGTPIGLLMGLSRWTKGVFDTPIEFYWPLPPLAYLPLMIIWLGIGEVSKITLLTMAMFAPIALSARAGVRSVSIERVHAALSLGATRFQLLCEIVLPSALPGNP